MKGVSPVVATVLMVAVAIAAAVVAYSWFMSMQSQIQAEASRGASTVGKERFSISSVYCDDSNYLTLVFQNMGDEGLTNADITVYVKDADTGEVDTFDELSGVDLPAQEPTTTTTNISCNSIPENIIVEAHLPGGAVVSKPQRIR